VKPVKLGEGPERKLELTPSQAPVAMAEEGVESRRRAPKVGRLRWRRAPDHEPRGRYGPRGRRKP